MPIINYDVKKQVSETFIPDKNFTVFVCDIETTLSDEFEIQSQDLDGSTKWKRAKGSGLVTGRKHQADAFLISGKHYRVARTKGKHDDDNVKIVWSDLDELHYDSPK